MKKLLPLPLVAALAFAPGIAGADPVFGVTTTLVYQHPDPSAPRRFVATIHASQAHVLWVRFRRNGVASMDISLMRNSGPETAVFFDNVPPDVKTDAAFIETVEISALPYDPAATAATVPMPDKTIGWTTVAQAEMTKEAPHYTTVAALVQAAAPMEYDSFSFGHNGSSVCPNETLFTAVVHFPSSGGGAIWYRFHRSDGSISPPRSEKNGGGETLPISDRYRFRAPDDMTKGYRLTDALEVWEGEFSSLPRTAPEGGWKAVKTLSYIAFPKSTVGGFCTSYPYQ